jgi:5-methylthioribose kinase
MEDRGNCLFIMTAAPAEAATWKTQLLAGETCADTASTIGEMLAAMWRASSGRPDLLAAFGDQSVFDQLRLDPYYRSTAARHPDLGALYDALIQECRERRVALVHGDWSPKNFLVSGSSVMAIDFEVIHYGNPAFDTAFLLNHLALKSFYRPQWRRGFARAAAAFWSACSSGLPESSWLEASTIRHLGGLMLARIDGKSPAEYICEEPLKQRVREFARRLMLDPPQTIAEVFESL